MNTTIPEPTVSVIIPLYNDEPTIGLCLDSMLIQTYPIAEIIVVDDHSTDGGPAIASAYPCQVIKTTANGGPAAARNAGIVRARGDILFFIDADVAANPDAVANAVELLRGELGCGAVCGVTDKVTLTARSWIAQYRVLQSYYWRASSEGEITPWLSALSAVWRTAFDEVGLLNERLRQTEEVDFGVRLSRRYRIIVTSRVVGRHDDEERFLALASKLFHRARLRVPLYIRYGKFMRGFETRARALGAGAGAAFFLSAPLPLVAWPLAAVPLTLLALFVWSDFGMYRFVRNERGPAFLGFFGATYLAISVPVTAGAFLGAAEWLIRPSFRRLYDMPASQLSQPRQAPAAMPPRNH